MSAEIDQVSARPDDPAEDPRSPGDRRRALYPLLLLAPPMLWMVAIVLGGTRMQYNDYWQMIDGTLREDGWLDIGGLFEFQNEHPVVIAKILFWFNWLLTGGSNITLGLVVIAIVAVEGLILSRFVDEPERRTRVGLAVVAAAGVLLFSRQGIHNFFQAMSGAAWFTANLFALAAILARVRERTWLAIGLGVLASISYGTGLAVWPALVVVGMVLERRWRPDLRVLGYGALVTAGYFILRTPDLPQTDPSLIDIAKGSASVAGTALASSLGVTQLIGVLAVAGGVVLSVVAIRRHPVEAAPWLGVFVFGALSALLIGRSRAVYFDSFGTQSRYTSISALVWIGVIGLLAVVTRYRARALVPILSVTLIALLTGGPQVRLLRSTVPDQEVFAAAMRLDLADGADFAVLIDYPHIAPLLDEIDHYPFDGAWDGDCGLSGEQLPMTTATDPEDGHVQQGGVIADGRGLRLYGWVPEERLDDVDCVVVTDWTRRVVGSGALGAGDAVVTNVDEDRTFQAVAASGSPPYSVWTVLDDGTLQRLDGRMTAAALYRGEEGEPG